MSQETQIDLLANTAQMLEGNPALKRPIRSPRAILMEKLQGMAAIGQEG